MIAKTLRKLGLAAALAGLSLLVGAHAVAQTDEGDGDEGLRATREAMAYLQEHNARQRKRVEYLSASGSPRDWAMASQIDVTVIEPGQDTDQADFAERYRKASAERAGLLRNAAAAAPRDALVQWLALHRMPRTSAGCSSSAPPQERIDALLALEPDNALAWTATLDQAVAAKDDVAIDTTLARMAAARRFDDHGAEYTLAVLEIDRRFPDTVDMPSETDDAQKDDAAFVAALMQGFWMDRPSHGFGDVCDAGKQIDADIRRFAACADFGRRLSREAPRLTLRSAGFELLRDSAQFDADDAAREREQQWLMSQIVSFESAAEGEAVELLRVGKAAWLERHDDAAALRAVLEHRGISTTPPIGWQPSLSEDEETDE